jgi:hypothetical protein
LKKFLLEVMGYHLGDLEISIQTSTKAVTNSGGVLVKCRTILKHCLKSATADALLYQLK